MIELICGLDFTIGILKMSMLRVFTAISIPEAQKRKIFAVTKRFQSYSNLRIVEQAGLHITLNFIGDVEDREIPKLCQTLTQALNANAPFEISLGALGAFPNFDRPRAFWVGVQQGESELVEINQKFRDIIEDFGFLQEKRFLPHVTIGRTQHRNVESDLVSELQSRIDRLVLDPFVAKNVVVFNSLLEKGTPTYIPLATMPL